MRGAIYYTTTYYEIVCNTLKLRLYLYNRIKVMNNSFTLYTEFFKYIVYSFNLKIFFNAYTPRSSIFGTALYRKGSCILRSLAKRTSTLLSRPTSAALTSSSGQHYSVLTELLQIVRIYHSYAIAVGYIAR